MSAPNTITDERFANASGVVREVLLAASKTGAVIAREDGDDENPDWIVVVTPEGSLSACFLFDFDDYATRVVSQECRRGLNAIRRALGRKR